MFKSCHLSSSSLNTRLTVQVTPTQTVLTQHWFDYSIHASSVGPSLHWFGCSSHVSSSSFSIDLTVQVTNHSRLVLDWAMQINLLWSYSSYACLDSMSLVRTINVSECASQLHMPCMDEVQPSSHATILELHKPMRSSGSQLNGFV